MSTQLQTKWKAILEHADLAPIKDSYRKQVTAILLENQENSLREQRQIHLNETAPTNVAGNVDRFDPILINLLRRTQPNLMAYDICGVQPMKSPVGQVFAMKSRYGTSGGNARQVTTSSPEALFNEADTAYSGATGPGPFGPHNTNVLDSSNAIGLSGTGMSLAVGEAVNPQEMGFTLERISVTAVTRALKAEYSEEMAHDLKNMHDLDAESILSNILSTEILAEQNREVMRTIYRIAKAGAQTGTTTAGVFDLDTDSDGRWSVERFKGLIFQVAREASKIARETRMGKGNIIICSADVASAFEMAGKLDYTPAMSTDLNVDDTGNTYAGMLNNKYKVYVDPYFSAHASASYTDLMVVGYKGKNPFDAGLFFCPYVPLTKSVAIDPETFQPKIGFKTRYGIVGNPLSTATIDTTATNGLVSNTNTYYRRVLVNNIL